MTLWSESSLDDEAAQLPDFVGKAHLWDIYSHVLPTMHQAASDKLEQILATGTLAAHK
jgi:hypothetical protein